MKVKPKKMTQLEMAIYGYDPAEDNDLFDEEIYWETRRQNKTKLNDIKVEDLTKSEKKAGVQALADMLLDD